MELVPAANGSTTTHEKIGGGAGVGRGAAAAAAAAAAVVVVVKLDKKKKKFTKIRRLQAGASTTLAVLVLLFR
jgi:mevalonate pyrophosphate decarboxylase